MPDVIDRTTAFAGRLFDVETVGWQADGQRIERDIVRHPGAVLIVPCLPDDQLVLIRNQRVAVDDTLWEFPAGTAESGEPAIDTARRELIEETGYRCSSIEPLGRFYTSPGFADELMHVFIATGLTHVGQQLEAHEQIDVEVRSRAEVLAMIAHGTIVDGKSIAAMLMLQQHNQRPSNGGNRP